MLVATTYERYLNYQINQLKVRLQGMKSNLEKKKERKQESSA